MDLKKKLNILLISVLGMSTVLALVFVGFLALQRNLAIPKVQASPGSTCTVNDTLAITGNRIRFTGTDGAGYSWITRSLNDDSQILIGWDGSGNTSMGCIGIEGGCLATIDTKECSTNAKDCRCDSGGDIAEVTCPDGYYLIAGGCDSDSGSVGLSHNTARGDPPDRWYCNWAGSVGWERAKAICCRINVNWDSTLRTVSD